MKLKQVKHWLVGSLQRRMLAAFLLVIGISIGAVAIAVGQFAQIRLDQLGVLASQRRAFRIAPFLADDYRQHNSWSGVAPLVERFNTPIPLNLINDTVGYYARRQSLLDAAATDRLILLDTGGLVMVDSAADLIAGQPLPESLRPYVMPVMDNGRPIGSVVLVSGLEHEIAAAVLTTLQRTLLGAGVIAGGLAVLASLLLAQRLTRPLRHLSQAAQRLSTGETTTPLPVPSPDEIGQLTQAFNQMLLALEEQKRLRRQLVADIAHELRTPLSVMHLDLESLDDGLQPPHEAALSLRDELNELNRLIEDLRQLSLADTGALDFIMTKLAPEPFLERIMASWQTQARHLQVKISPEIILPLPLIYADEGRLTQALNNIIRNALRYSDPDNIVIIGAQHKEDELLVWVSDKGPGIAPEHLPHIFERFYRVDPSRSRETGGSGLGLAIARQFVTMHHGRIWAESEPGTGTTIYIALPVPLFIP